MTHERIINEGISQWQPNWVVYDQSMRVQLFASSDFNRSLKFFEQEVRREKLECSTGSCED